MEGAEGIDVVAEVVAANPTITRIGRAGWLAKGLLYTLARLLQCQAPGVGLPRLRLVLLGHVQSPSLRSARVIKNGRWSLPFARRLRTRSAWILSFARA